MNARAASRAVCVRRDFHLEQQRQAVRFTPVPHPERLKFLPERIVRIFSKQAPLQSPLRFADEEAVQGTLQRATRFALVGES